MRRVILDFIFVVPAIAVAFLLAGSPPPESGQLSALTEAAAVSQNPVPPESGQLQAAVSSAAAGQPTDQPALKPKMSNVNRQVLEGAAAGKRNIFTPSGSYKDAGSSAFAIMPENPYELIGIVREGGIRALFREYTGNVIVAPIKHKMIDGFVVKTIGPRKVITEKGEEKKEFSLFNAEEPTIAIKGKVKNAPAQPPVLIGIAGGNVRKAVFRNESGVLTQLALRETLPDGSIIARIDPQFVVVRKGGENKELKPRAAEIPPPSARKKKDVYTGKAAETIASEMSNSAAPQAPGSSPRRPRRARPANKGKTGAALDGT